MLGHPWSLALLARHSARISDIPLRRYIREADDPVKVAETRQV